MAIDERYLQFILDQLSDFGPVNTKRMFGEVGFFCDGLMFAKMGGDSFRLKVDEHNQADYEVRGMKPYHSEKKKKGMPYWEVPTDVVEDREQLNAWAQKALQAAKRAKNNR